MRNRTIVIDIETLPMDEIPENGDDSQVDYLKTALNGNFGRILCIGFVDDGPDGITRCGVLGWNNESDVFINNEKNILSDFWKLMHGFNPKYDRIVGHNIFDFDLRFILKRSIFHQVKPTVELSFAKYRSQPIFDTMYEWECWSFGAKIALDRLAQILNLPSSKSDEVNGSRIYDLYKEGQHKKIYDYCLRDVKLTREIYRLMTFANDNSKGTKKLFPKNILSLR